MRFLQTSLILAVLLMPSKAFSQSIEAIYGVGRAFDIPSATWMNFHVPALEVSAKGFTFNAAHMLDFDLKSSETDLTFMFKVPVKSKLTFQVIAAKMFYHVPFERKSDYKIFLETRWRLKS